MLVESRSRDAVDFDATKRKFESSRPKHAVAFGPLSVTSTGKAATDPANKKLLVVPINEQLPPGDYKVEWYAVSDDTHRVKGSFSFSVAR